MISVLERIKNIFKRDRGIQNLPPGSYPNTSGVGQTLGTIRKPSYLTDEDDNDEDIQSLRNYNIPEETRRREQQRNTVQSDDTARSGNPYGNGSTLRNGPLNSPNAQFRGASSGFVPGLPLNNNSNNRMNFSSNTNTGFTPDPPSRAGLPFVSQIQDPSSRSALNPTSTSVNNPQTSFSGFPPIMNPDQSAPPLPSNPPSSFGGFSPGMNSNQSAPPPSNNPPSSFGGFPPGMSPNQSSAPSTTNNPPSSFGGFPSGMNLNQTSPPPPPTTTTTNPQSSLDGFPPGINSQSSPSTQISPMNDSNNLMNAQQGPLTKRMSSFRNQSNDDDNVSRLELDYPIENVLIDANIPSAIAIKLNEVVEKDRLGNAYHIHHYTFEPSSPQQIAFGNNHHLDRRLVGNTYHGGTRHIREIHNDNQNSLFDDMLCSRRSNKHHRRRRRYSDTSLNQYIDQLLHTPGSFVIQADNYNNLQHIFNPHPNNQIIPTQSSVNPFQFSNNTFAEPIFYYTARALPNDPMRHY